MTRIRYLSGVVAFPSIRVTYIPIACIIAAIVTVFSQFYSINTLLGLDFLSRETLLRHQAIVTGAAIAPYRYRVLSDLLLDLIMQSGVPYLTAAFLLRLIQNTLVFLFAYRYFGLLGLSRRRAFIGLILIGYAFLFGFYASDLSFYTYSELIFLLLATIFIQVRRDHWLIPLTFLAAFNREGAAFIPVLLFASRAPHWTLDMFKTALLSALVFLVVYIGLRVVLGPADYAHSRYGDVYPGASLLIANLANPLTWLGLSQMYNLLPLTLFRWREWQPILLRYLLAFALPWFLLNFLYGSADETRLFLAPLVLVFIPATLTVLVPVYAVRRN